jgi:hypothetical protein
MDEDSKRHRSSTTDIDLEKGASESIPDLDLASRQEEASFIDALARHL